MNRTLTRLTRPPEEIRYPDDVAKLTRELEILGYEVSPADVQWAYEQYSESMSAGWMNLSSWNNVRDAADHILQYLVQP